MKKLIPLLSLALLIPSVLLNIYYFINAKPNTGISVVEVLDGDTILLEQKTRFRLRQIDAPELQNCGGLAAKNELTKLVKNKNSFKY